MAFLDKIPMRTAIVMALFLGFLPFFPEPHVLSKLKMLFSGTLVKPIDMFDLLFHGAPWLLLFAKLIRFGSNRVQ